MLKFENQQKIYYDIFSVCSIASWYTILPWRMVPAWSRSSTSDNKPDLEEWCMDGQGHWFLTTSLILKNGAWMAKVINFWQQAWPWRMVPGWPRSLTWQQAWPWRMVTGWSRLLTSDNNPDLEEWCLESLDGQGH